jgi:hypothetical protein
MQVGIGGEAWIVPSDWFNHWGIATAQLSAKTKGKLHISRNMFYSLRVTFLSADHFISVPYHHQ